ncbi:hypothetical protein J6590_032381 [Homalodisca vitripennis]|nr:hypothetical protein J6590_032381 [Homalodisca vitripennis]
MQLMGQVVAAHSRTSTLTSAECWGQPGTCRFPSRLAINRRSLHRSFSVIYFLLMDCAPCSITVPHLMDAVSETSKSFKILPTSTA